MPIIRAGSGIITQVNVFTVPQGGQDAMIHLLAEAAEFARSTPGWLSASLRHSLNGTRVVNYSQSESLEAAQRVAERLREAGYIERNSRLGIANPGLYEVSVTIER